MKTENIIKLLDANLYFIQNVEMENIKKEIQNAMRDKDPGYLEAMRGNYVESKASLHTINWIRELFDMPECYGEPNELCSASHPETDEDCPYLKMCFGAFKMLHDSLTQTITEEEEK